MNTHNISYKNKMTFRCTAIKLPGYCNSNFHMIVIKYKIQKIKTITSNLILGGHQGSGPLPFPPIH